MFSDQILKARMVVGVLALSATVAGCSLFSRSQGTDTGEPTSTTTPDASAIAPVEEMTATEAAVAHASSSPEAAPVEPAPSDIISPTAPKNYTVKRGDTLWDIASLFLRDPWVWPEVWYINPQIQNPHLIYPGDQLSLAYGADGRPQIRLERGDALRLDPRLRSSPLDGAIPSIPYGAISAFLSRPSVLTADDVRRAPHVLALREEHMIGGTGHEIYVRNLRAAENARYNVVHIGVPLRDPDDGDVIGYEGIYTATATVTNAGNPAKAVLSDAERETLQGDKLFTAAADATALNFQPRAPEGEVEGRIISVVDGMELIGQYQIVVINRGKKHGIEPGHVLAVDQAGAVVRDKYAQSRFGVYGFGSAFKPRVQLPEERAGTLLVFKSFDRLSYALVMVASSPMRVADVVRNP